MNSILTKKKKCTAEVIFLALSIYFLKKKKL